MAGDEDDKALLFDVAGMRGSLLEHQLRSEIEGGQFHRERAEVERALLRARRAHARPVRCPPVSRSSAEWDMADLTHDAEYNPCPEAFPADGVPRGKVKSFRGWVGTGAVFPGVKRDLYIYTPRQLSAESRAPPALMLLNDAEGLDAAGPIRACAVLDSLIHGGELAPTVAIFITPGRPIDCPTDAELIEQQGGDPQNFVKPPEAGLQRQVEYDRVTDAYPRFIDEEVVPFAEEHVGTAFSSDPSRRLMVGISSGGVAAFNAAWHRPHSWGLVLSHCGSFTGLNGGQNYPFVVRRSPRKDIRVVLTSGSNDMDNVMGNWALANHTMADALRFAGYDYRYDFGSGGHNSQHGGALFAEHLRWLFRPREAAAATGSRL